MGRAAGHRTCRYEVDKGLFRRCSGQPFRQENKPDGDAPSGFPRKRELRAMVYGIMRVSFCKLVGTIGSFEP